MICKANQWTGFYMIGTSVMKVLNQQVANIHETYFAANVIRFLRPVQEGRPKAALICSCVFTASSSFLHNSLTELHGENLQSDKLKFLSCIGNQISLLDRKVFDGVPNLKAMYFSNNTIKILPEYIFSKLKDLQFVDFSFNQIQDLPDNLFKNNGKLVIL